MDSRLTALLREIEDAEENRWTADDKYLTTVKKFDSSTIASAKSFGFLSWSGIGYYLTEKGHERLDTGRSLEYLEKIHRAVNTEKTGIIFDSNIFDKLVDGKLSPNEIELSQYKGFEYFITHIQVDELSKTPDPERRSRLLLVTTKLKPTIVGTESFALGISRLDASKLGDGETLDIIRTEKNHTNDGLIGEVAVKKKLILVSEDQRLRTKVIEQGGKAVALNEFKEMIK